MADIDNDDKDTIGVSICNHGHVHLRIIDKEGIVAAIALEVEQAVAFFDKIGQALEDLTGVSGQDWLDIVDEEAVELTHA